MYVVGAANSAGQAALNLARYAKRVVLLVRGAALEDTMSQYLVARILAAPNVEVRLRTEVVAARGDGHLEALTLADRDTGRRGGRADQLAVRLHRRLAAHRLARRRRRARRARASCVTGPDLLAADDPPRWPLAAAAVRAGDQRARACSRPATSGSTR